MSLGIKETEILALVARKIIYFWLDWRYRRFLSDTAISDVSELHEYFAIIKVNDIFVF